MSQRERELVPPRSMWLMHRAGLIWGYWNREEGYWLHSFLGILGKEWPRVHLEG